MLTISEALAQILPAFTPRGTERVGLADAAGRILAEDVSARWDLPPFDNSAMDGYAVAAATAAAAPATLPVSGESRAGGGMPEPLAAGAAMRIFTGAPLPPGADAVVMQEDTRREGERVVIEAAPRAGQHVRRRGEDLAAGAAMLAGGARLGPGEIGLLAGQGVSSVSVFRRPRIALLSTGDELRDVSDPPVPGTIVNSNAYALAAQVTEAGGDPWVLPIAPDVEGAIAERVREGLRADVLITVGGVSVGDYDLVHTVLAGAGVERRLWKVAIKPGKPVCFGVHGDVPVVGLPGNPIGAMITFEVFVRPALRRMLGDPRPHRAVHRVRLAHAHRHKPGRTELARAAFVDGGEGEGGARSVRLHSRQGSGSLPSMVGVDALVILPPDREAFEEGDELRALVPGAGLGAATSPFEV